MLRDSPASLLVSLINYLFYSLFLPPVTPPQTPAKLPRPMNHSRQHHLTKTFILLMSAAVGLMAANLYYLQPIVGPIAQTFGLAASSSGIIVTMAQLGYGLGVLLLIPLGDLLENRKLILTCLVSLFFGLLLLGFSSSLWLFLLSAFIVGVCASAVQIIVPYVAHFSTEEERGGVVGTLMSGLMLGIMLSRPVSSLVTDLMSWPYVFFLSAFFIFILAIALWRVLPDRRPQEQGLKYFGLIATMPKLMVETPVLQRRAIYQSCMFGAFCLYWTTVPLWLLGPAFNFSQKQVALFALAGLAGAISAPIAGKIADKGHTRLATFIALLAGIISFIMAAFLPAGSWSSLAILLVAANILDAGVSANLVLGQRRIFLLDANQRSRMNGLYIATIFVGGSLGSYLGVYAYSQGGWQMTCLTGICFPVIAMLYFLTEKRTD